MGMIAYYYAIGEDERLALVDGGIKVEEFIDKRSLAEEEAFDIDKAWQGIQYLLNGDAWEGSGPLFDLVLGGSEIGSADFGCGPARVLGAERVKACALAAAALDFESLRSRYDWKALAEAEIYPGFDHDEFDYLAYYFSLLADFFARAAESGSALLLFIS
jgi:hypothetical protein